MNLSFINIGALTMAIFVIPILVLFGYTIYHIVRNRKLTGIQRILWYLLVLCTSGLGLLAYWLFGKYGSPQKGHYYTK